MVSLPKTYTPEDAYIGKTTRFTEMMRARGHDVVLYGAEGSDVVCSNAGASTLDFEPSSARWIEMNPRVVEEAKARATGRDILCIVAGVCQQMIADSLPDFLSCEPFVGYGGTSTKYRVFESEAWRHTVYGDQALNSHEADGRFYDDVIPNYYKASDFALGHGLGDYLLFVGRLTERKGPQIAAEVAELAGLPLLLAGPGEWHGYGTHLGVVDHERRAELMRDAVALLAPTIYVEPFGGVAAEAQLFGTPVLSTPWGAFSETIIQGVTGYKCHLLREWLTNLELCDKLDRKEIQKSAMSRFSYEVVAPRYEAWFSRLETLWSQGWYSK